MWVYIKSKGIAKSLCLFYLYGQRQNGHYNFMCIHQHQCVQIDPFADRYIPAAQNQLVMDKCDKNVWVIANIIPMG